MNIWGKPFPPPPNYLLSLAVLLSDHSAAACGKGGRRAAASSCGHPTNPRLLRSAGYQLQHRQTERGQNASQTPHPQHLSILQLLRGLSLRELLQKHLQQHRNTSDGSPAHKLSPSSAAFLISPSLLALVFTSKRPPEHCKLFNFQQAALRSGKLKFKALIKAGKKKKKTCILRKKNKMKFSRRSSASEMGLPCAQRVWWEVTEGRRNFVLPSPTSPSLEARGETGRQPRRGIMSQ